MKKHTSIYLKHFGMDGFDEPPFMPCEVCTQALVDIHHIEPRGMGSSKDKDRIENLMGLCRKCHLKAESKEYSQEWLQRIHNKNLDDCKSNNKW